MSELPKKMSLQTFSIFIVFFLVKLEFSMSTKHGIVEITASNYQRLVIDGDKDAWIVAVKGAGKVSMDEWRKTELDMRGLSVRVGIIDPDTDGAFLKRKVNCSLFRGQSLSVILRLILSLPGSHW